MAPPYAKPKRWGNLMSCCIRPAPPQLICENHGDGKKLDRACLLCHSDRKRGAEEEEEAINGRHRRSLHYPNREEEEEEEPFPFTSPTINGRQRSRKVGLVLDPTNPSDKENSVESLASAAISVLVQNRERCALSLLEWDGKVEVENGGSVEEEECRSGWFKRLMRTPFTPSKLSSSGSNNGAALLRLKNNDRLPRSSSYSSSPRSSTSSSPRSSKRMSKNKKKVVSSMREIDAGIQDHLHKSVFQRTNENINITSSSASQVDLPLYNSTNSATNNTLKKDGRKRALHYCCFTDPSYALKKKILSSKRGFSEKEERGSLLLF